MKELNVINLNGVALEVTDTKARETANNALNKADNAQKSADSKSLISYDETETTIVIR